MSVLARVLARLSLQDGSLDGSWAPKSGGACLALAEPGRLFVLGGPLRGGLIAYPLEATDVIFATGMD